MSYKIEGKKEEGKRVNAAKCAFNQSCQNKINPKMNISIYFDYDDIFKLIIYFKPKTVITFSIFKLV